MEDIEVVIVLTDDQYKGAKEATALHNLAATLVVYPPEVTPPPPVVFTVTEYLQDILASACQSYYNGLAAPLPVRVLQSDIVPVIKKKPNGNNN